MNFSPYQSYIVNLMHSHMDGNYRWRQGLGLIFFFFYLNLNLHLYKLIWIFHTLTWRFMSWFHSGFAFFSIILVHSYIKRWLLVNNIDRRRTQENIIYLNMEYLLASKADFYIWIHQVLLISITSKDLFHRLNKGIIHCNVKYSLNREFFKGFQLQTFQEFMSDLLCGTSSAR